MAGGRSVAWAGLLLSSVLGLVACGDEVASSAPTIEESALLGWWKIVDVNGNPNNEFSHVGIFGDHRVLVVDLSLEPIGSDWAEAGQLTALPSRWDEVEGKFRLDYGTYQNLEISEFPDAVLVEAGGFYCWPAWLDAIDFTTWSGTPQRSGLLTVQGDTLKIDYGVHGIERWARWEPWPELGLDSAERHFP